MAVLKHPNIAFGGATAPKSIAELVAISSVFPLIIPITAPGVRLRHPEPDFLEDDTGGGSGGPVGYAT